jgi:hypothetical protein
LPAIETPQRAAVDSAAEKVTAEKTALKASQQVAEEKQLSAAEVPGRVAQTAIAVKVATEKDAADKATTDKAAALTAAWSVSKAAAAKVTLGKAAEENTFADKAAAEKAVGGAGGEVGSLMCDLCGMACTSESCLQHHLSGSKHLQREAQKAVAPIKNDAKEGAHNGTCAHLGAALCAQVPVSHAKCSS